MTHEPRSVRHVLYHACVHLFLFPHSYFLVSSSLVHAVGWLRYFLIARSLLSIVVVSSSPLLVFKA
ncbi:hypothetical protein H4582DRAFT_1962558 [Lactarius indigo]|nr:hypothetical protein H4582DRAFT_1962558 [Lactarius indigo]